MNYDTRRVVLLNVAPGEDRKASHVPSAVNVFREDPTPPEPFMVERHVVVGISQDPPKFPELEVEEFLLWKVEVAD